IARLSDLVPTRVYLQISRNNVTEFTRDRRRKGRFDSGVAAGVLTRSLFLLAAGDSRRYIPSRFGYRYRFAIVGENGAEFLADIDGIANFGLPFAHYSGEGRLNRINRLIGFDFAKIIVERNRITGFFQKRNNLRVANSLAHDWNGDALCVLFRDVDLRRVGALVPRRRLGFAAGASRLCTSTRG